MRSRRVLFGLVLLLVMRHAGMVAQQATPSTPEGQAGARVPVQNLPVEPPPPLPLARGRVTGKIICNDTRQPARGATVLLLPVPSDERAGSKNGGRAGGMIAGRVGLDGTYTIEHAPEGEYAVIALLPGYLSLLDSVTIGADGQNSEAIFRDLVRKQGAIRVGANGTTTGDLVLERGATVAGRVLYSDGSPATQMTIELQNVDVKKPKAKEQMQFDAGALFRAMFTHQTASTDDQGHFRISGIKAGTYRIAAAQPINVGEQLGAGDAMGLGMAALVGGGAADQGRVYAGDTMHRGSAKTYELRPGDTLADIEIRVPVSGMHTVRVRLSASDGRTINRATLRLVDASDESLAFSAANEQEGVYRFDTIPPGTYTLTASDATIGEPYAPPVAAFEDGSTSVIVKDNDVSDALLSLKERPLPKQDPNAKALADEDD